MDPLTTLGLVGNVIQVIEFASSLGSETYQFAKSGSEALPQSEWLDTRAQQLKDLTDCLPGPVPGGQVASPSETALHQSNKACQDEASKLIAILGGLRAPNRPDGTKSKRLAVKQVFRSRWRASDIEASRKRLEASERRLNLALVACIRNSQADEFKNIKTILQRHGNESKVREQALKNIECEVNDLASRIERSQHKKFESIEKRLQQSGDESRVQCETLQRIERGVDRIEDDHQSTEERKFLHFIISTLDYPERTSREQVIEDRHWTTFNWVLRDSRFKEWLDGGEQVVFWVSGHPGSGKSTFMKYLGQNLLDANSLDGKTYEDSVLLAKHYFWIAGTREERSVLSMLRNLLLQVLCNAISVSVLKISPSEIIEHMQSKGTLAIGHGAKAAWTLDQLVGLFGFVACHISTQIILLIDGLDECKESSHNDLVGVLKRLAAMDKIRLCLSSRPWNVFERAFENTPAKVLLQTLTSNDMYVYACERLQSADPTLSLGISMGSDGLVSTHQTMNIRFNRDVPRNEYVGEIDSFNVSGVENATNDHRIDLKRQEAGEGLVQRLLTKADGVFFWLTLVLDTLCTRLSDGYSLDHLQRFVDEFPPKLEDYFEKFVYERIADTYRKSAYPETTMALKIALVGTEAQRPYKSDRGRHGDDGGTGGHLSFLHFWLLRESAITEQGVTVNPRFGEEATLRTFTEAELRRMAADTSRYLAGCCKDFLHVPEWQRPLNFEGNEIPTEHSATAKVIFRHRIAYDFLGTRSMQRLINGNVPSHFLEDDFWQQMIATAELRLRQAPYEYIDLLYFRPAELAINEQLQYKHHIMVAYEEFFLEWLEGRLDANTAADALRCLEEKPQRANSLLTALLEHGCSRLLKYLLTTTTARFPVTVRNDYNYWLLDVACGLAMRAVRLDTIDSSVVRLLLNKGANPNDLSYRLSREIGWEGTAPDQVSSTWHRLLIKMLNESKAPDACRIDANNGRLAQEIPTEGQRDTKFTLARLMIEHGANMDSPLFRPLFDRDDWGRVWESAGGNRQCNELPILDVLKKVLTPNDFLEIKALVPSASTAQKREDRG